MLPVVVIGGGPAGSVCARRLARMGHRVVLYERRAACEPRAAETCTPRVRRALEAACDAPLPPGIVRPLAGFHAAWGASEFETFPFGFWQAGDGGVVERPLLDAFLLDRAAESGVAVHRGCRIVDGHPSGATWLLSVEDGAAFHSVEACFVVEATGAATRSPVQPHATRFFTDGLMCISTEVADVRGEDTAGVEAGPAGWWYTAGTATGRRTISYFTDADVLAANRDRRELFRRELLRTEHVRRFLGEPVGEGALRISSARTSIRRLLWNASWLAIGDAARTIDPLSGGGIGRAVEDAVKAADAISAALLQSDANGLRRLALETASGFAQQLEVQREQYARERRWRGHAFWSRRTEAQA